MTMVLELTDTPQNNDIFIYENGKLKPTRSDIYLATVNTILKEKTEQIEALQREIDNIKTSINKKLEEYHNILQTLVKEK